MNGIKKQEQFKFSLSIHDKHDRAVRKIVEGLRKRGKLSQSIRDGLRLLNDLRRGRTKVLLELFPDIIERLCPPEPKTDDDLKNEIVALRRAIAEQGRGIPDSRDNGFPEMQPAFKPLASMKKMSKPVDDDDVIEKKQVIGDMTATDNFFASFARLG